MMPWTRLDDGLDEHPKVDVLVDNDELHGLAAVGLWTLTLANSNRRLTDGQVSERTLRKLAPKHGAKLAKMLTEAGLYDDLVDLGLCIHDYLDFNPSRASVEEKRRRDSERKAAGRSNRNPNGIHAESTRTEERNPEGSNADVHAESTRPEPEPTPIPKTTPGRGNGNNSLRLRAGSSNVEAIAHSTTSEEAA